MAIIRKIREKSGLAVGLVAGGLILFLLGRDILGLKSTILGRNRTDVGEIAGQKVSIQDYQKHIDELKYNFSLQHDRPPNETEQARLREQAWQQLIEATIYQKEYNALGLQVSEEELIDMVQGEHIHPDLIATFTDPKTGEFDKNQLLKYLQHLSQMPLEQQMLWHNFEKSLVATRRKTKFNQLIVQSNFVTDLEAQKKHNLSTTSLHIKYLYIPYYTFPDSLIEVKDSMLHSYLDKHRNEYKVEERRGMQYVSFPIIPSSEDTLTFEEVLRDLLQEFKQAKDDSIFAKVNTDGDPSHSYGSFTRDQLPKALAQSRKKLQKNLLIGPVEEEGVYKIYKVTAVKPGKPTTYEVAILEKQLLASDDTRDKVFRKADYFASMVANKTQFEENAAKEGLRVYDAMKVDKNDFRVGILNNAREIVRWLYNNAVIGKVSPVFELETAYVVAIMTDKQKAGTASLAHIRDEISLKVKNELKASKIIARLEVTADSTLASIAAQYGQAEVLEDKDIKFKDNILKQVGFAKNAIGKAFALQEGERTAPLEDENGVLMVELVKRQEAPKLVDYTSYKNDMLQRERLMQSYATISESMKYFAKIKDYRYKFH